MDDGAAKPIAPGQLTQLLAELAEAPAAESDDAAVPLVGDRLGRFLLVREIGRGGFGVVFEAEDTELRRRVALKIVLPKRSRPEPEEWVHREAEAAAQLRHPHIVTLFDAGVSDGRTFLVYELLRGEPLDAWIDDALPPRREAVRVLADVASALAHLHAAGVVHRDLKGANVFIESDGTVKVLDLGLAQVAGASGHAAGSPPYAAPEQWRGERVDARADVHAWGVLGYRLLTGDLPRAGAAPLRAAKHSVEELVEAARAVDPERRPRDGAALVAALRAIERRRARARNIRLGGLALAALAALAVAGAELLRTPALPPGPFRIAVADAVNSTGVTALDGVGDLVARGLDAPPRLQVLDRARLGGVLRSSRRVAPERLDRAAATFAARQAGAAAVIVPTVTAAGAGFELALDVREPETDRLLASVVEAAASQDTILAAVERLVRRTREALDDKEHDVRAADREIARTVSTSLEAHQRYFAGRRCIDHPSEGASWVRLDACAHHFQEALTIDPDFPLAHFELAWLARWEAHSTESLAAILEPALRRADRLPLRQQAQLLAWKAELDGDLDRAAEILRVASEQFPEDAHVALARGELFYRQGRHAEAVAPLERAVALDPGLELASAELTWSLIVLGRTDALRALADRMAASAPSPGTLHAEIAARGASGDVATALALARKAAMGGGGAASEDLEDALVAAGEWDEAESLLRQKADAGVPRAARRLGTLLFMRGRAREALPLSETPPPNRDEPRMRFVAAAWRAHRLASARDAVAVRQIIEETRAWSPEIAATLAPTAAYVGEVGLARALLPGLEPGSGDRELAAAVVTWREGDGRAALPLLRRIALGTPAVSGSVPAEAPLWIAAECAAEVEPGESALGDIKRFQRFYAPLGMWRAWAYPRSLVLEARQLATLGRRDEALAALARFDALWARADSGLPLLAEARALRRELLESSAPRMTR